MNRAGEIFYCTHGVLIARGGSVGTPSVPIAVGLEPTAFTPPLMVPTSGGGVVAGIGSKAGPVDTGTCGAALTVGSADGTCGRSGARSGAASRSSRACGDAVGTGTGGAVGVCATGTCAGGSGPNTACHASRMFFCSWMQKPRTISPIGAPSATHFMGRFQSNNF